MSRLTAVIRRLVTRTDGAEVTELAIVLALIVAVAVPVIALLGPKIAALFTVVNNAIP